MGGDAVGLGGDVDAPPAYDRVELTEVAGLGTASIAEAGRRR